MTEQTQDKFSADAPETKDQAEALLKQYYKEHRGEKDFPRRYQLLSWRLNLDGSMTVVDGASGRKLNFPSQSPFAYIDAEAQKIEAENAEADVQEAEAKADEAEAKAKQARAVAEQLKTNTEAKAKAAEAEAKKQAKEEAKAEKGKPK
jgi:hypothetical protein